MAKAPVTRASSPPAAAGKGAKSGGLHKQVMGLPAWMWGVGGVVLIGGYLWIRSHSPSSTTGQGQGKGGQKVAVVSPTGLSYEQFLLLLEDWQKTHHHGGGHGRHGGGHHTNKGGPERQWLIKKTGSQHPWTFLAQHHERIVIGPHGTRTIEKDKGGKGGKGHR